MSGRLSIRLSIIFFQAPNFEFIAFEPIVRPRIAIVLASPLPDCNFLVFFVCLFVFLFFWPCLVLGYLLG